METSVSSSGDDSAARVHLSGLSEVSALIKVLKCFRAGWRGEEEDNVKTSTG